MFCKDCRGSGMIGYDPCPKCWELEEDEDEGLFEEDEESIDEPVQIPVPTSATSTRNAVEQMGRYLGYLSQEEKTQAEAIAAYNALQRVLDKAEGYSGDILRVSWRMTRTK